MVSYPTVTILNRLASKQGILRFHFALGPANYTASSAAKINDCPTSIVLSELFSRTLDGTGPAPPSPTMFFSGLSPDLPLVSLANRIRVNLKKDPRCTTN